ncbi:HAMP domain-containing histidine kinase [Microbacterium lushaniae]|nr:HAMP domain-containing histidine kinase [Microbacterium lushaniae]KAA9155616.1 HAMP domain-containing histidine kinase [Microbacterium lushaniae]
MSLTKTAPVVGPDALTRTVERLATALRLSEITEIVAEAVRELTGADGATFVFREDGQCFYAEENAIGPLWKGHRFPLTSCVSGWAMLHRETVVIPDIYTDERVPHDAYRPTFVASLVMAPVRSADPIGALGAYWAEQTRPDPEVVRRLEVLADTAAVAVENLELRGAIGRRSAERDRFAARADDLDAAMHTLVHDLRGSLGVVTGYAELISEGADAASAADYAAAILRAGDRMSAQIERMLSIHRITGQPLLPQRCDLTLMARAIADDLRRHHPDRDLVIEVADDLTVWADPVLLHSLLENLLGNAVKFTARKAATRITVSPVGGGEGLVTFAVSDDGDGFAPEDAERLFRPLARLHSQEQFSGTGLGLASVARIAELHGGSVRAEGRPGSGATFTVALPAVA